MRNRKALSTLLPITAVLAMQFGLVSTLFAQESCSFMVPGSDFRIEEQPDDNGSPGPGDGWDEDTFWVFDLRQEMNGTFREAFPDLGELAVARISVEMSAGAGPASSRNNDYITLPGGGRINTGGALSIDENLLSFVSEASIREQLQWEGMLRMHYQDDASVNSAHLELVFDGSCFSPNVVDVRFGGGVFRSSSFPGVSARLSRGGAFIELQLTDDEGSYTFGEVRDEGGYELRITDTGTWGIQRSWQDLSGGEVHREVSLPATMMKQLSELADALDARHYNTSPVRSLITPYTHWADTAFTDMAEVDTSLARLMITHDAIRTMYDNTQPVAKELATAMAELIGFGITMIQSMRATDASIADVSPEVARALKFKSSAESFGATVIFNTLTAPVLAALPAEPPILKAAFTEARALILAEMQGALSGKGLDVAGAMRSAALRIGAQVGDDVLMLAFQSMTQEDLERAVTLADMFAYSGATQSAWRDVSDAGVANFAASNDAASFSELFRGTATGIGGITGVARGFERTIALARILRVVQLAGYVAAIGRTGWQFYDTAENDLPRAVDHAFGQTSASKTGPMIARPAGSARVETDELAQSIEIYLNRLDELVSLDVSAGTVYLEKVAEVVDAAERVAKAAAWAHLPILAGTRMATETIESYPEAHLHLLQTLVDAGMHHLALTGYLLGVIEGEATAADLAAQADSVRSAFEAILPGFEAVAELVDDLETPPFVAAVGAEALADSVEAGVPFTLRAAIRNGGGMAAEGVVARLVPTGNLDVLTGETISVGRLAAGQEHVLEWAVTASDTADWNAFQIYVDLSNGESVPYLGYLNVAGATVTGSDDEHSTLPQRIRLDQNYPNPFNPSTEIVVALPESGTVRLTVYDVLGREVVRLIDSRMNAGTHRIRFDATGLPSGVYVYRLESANVSLTRRMVLAK